MRGVQCAPEALRQARQLPSRAARLVATELALESTVFRRHRRSLNYFPQMPAMRTTLLELDSGNPILLRDVKSRTGKLRTRTFWDRTSVGRTKTRVMEMMVKSSTIATSGTRWVLSKGRARLVLTPFSSVKWAMNEYHKLKAALDRHRREANSRDYRPDEWIEVCRTDGIKPAPHGLAAIRKQIQAGETYIDPAPMYLKGCSLHAFVVGLIDPNVTIYCPRCHQKAVKKDMPKPRRYITWSGVAYTVTERFKCTSCKADTKAGKGMGNSDLTFLATNPDVFAALPEHITVNFPAFLTEKQGLEKSIVDSIPSTLAHGGTCASLAQLLREVQRRPFYEDMVAYERLTRDYVAHCRANPSFGRPQPIIVPWNTNFTDPTGWGGIDPSRELLMAKSSDLSFSDAVCSPGNYFLTVFLKLVAEFRGMWRTYTALLGGEQWSFDHSHKVRLQNARVVQIVC